MTDEARESALFDLEEVELKPFDDAIRRVIVLVDFGLSFVCVCTRIAEKDGKNVFTLRSRHNRLNRDHRKRHGRRLLTKHQETQVLTILLAFRLKNWSLTPKRAKTMVKSFSTQRLTSIGSVGSPNVTRR